MTRRVRRDDRGTSLLIVLMIITVVALVTGVILSQEGASLKVTDALREQSATSYGADAAAQAAVTQLKNGQLPCTTPGATTRNLGNGASSAFYAASGTSGGSLNAVVSCSPDTVNGVLPGPTTGSGTKVTRGVNVPTAAITTVGSSPADGVIAVAPFSLCVQGSVISYTTITGILKTGTNSASSTACPNAPSSDTTVQAFGNPLLKPIIPGCVGIFPVTDCTPLGASTPPIPTVPDPVPGYTITKANTDQAAICTTSGSTTYAAFLPGLYTIPTSSTSSFSLANPCANGSKKWMAANVEWFTPGVYYFNFSTATTWTLPATVVGGTPTTASGTPITGLNLASPTSLTKLSQMPTGEGKCVPPTAQTQANEGGVEFVFGGPSTMTGMTPTLKILTLSVGPSTDLDLCATYDPNNPPVAIYGVQHPLTVAGGTVIPAESGCVATPGCVGAVNSLLNWPTVSVFGLATPLPVDQTFHLDGYMWAPTAGIVITYAASNGQAFNWGVLVRSFQMLGLTSLTMANLPPDNGGIVTSSIYTVRYVNVWTCAAAASPCPQTGQPDVQIKLQQTGATWKVLSWSQQR